MTWQDDARCRGMDPSFFFPSPNKNIQQRAAEIREVCSSCPVRRECLTHALDYPEDQGWWGGKSPREIRQLRRHRSMVAV